MNLDSAVEAEATRLRSQLRGTEASTAEFRTNRLERPSSRLTARCIKRGRKKTALRLPRPLQARRCCKPIHAVDRRFSNDNGRCQNARRAGAVSTGSRPRACLEWLVAREQSSMGNGPPTSATLRQLHESGFEEINARLINNQTK